jgi:rhodanese-related sulfurtransferase
MVGLNPATTFSMDFSLELIQADLEKKFDNIIHIDGATFSILNTDNTLVFDVRQRTEFDVSHIKNAIRIDQDITNEDFIQRYNKQLKGRNIIFYCSVGQRSSLLASRLKPLILNQGAKEIYNLKGGIFQWHNEQRALIQNGKPTQYIHPFSPMWSLLLKDKQTIKFFPTKDPIQTH